MKIYKNDVRINLSRIQTETRQIVPYHRSDRVINGKILNGSSVTADFGYRCEVFSHPHFNPSPRYFENPDTYRKYFQLLHSLYINIFILKFRNFSGSRITSLEDVTCHFLRAQCPYVLQNRANSYIMVSNST